MLADDVGFYARTTTTALPGHGDASRVVLADALADDEEDEARFGRHYLHIVGAPYAGTVRRILETGYEGPHAALRLSRPLAAPLASGATIEVSWPLPIRRHLTIKGLSEIVDEALARCEIEIRLQFTGDGTRSYSLASYSTLVLDEAQTRGIYDRRGWGPADVLSLSSQRYRFVRNGADVSLITGPEYAASDTFQLAVVVNGARFIHDGSAWAATTIANAGLQGNDTYMAAVPLHWVRAIGMVKALQQWRKLVVAEKRLDDQTRALTLGDIDDRKAHWARAAANIIQREFPQPVAEPTVPMLGTSYLPPSWP